MRALAIAREKLEQAWQEQGGTDAEVLAAGAEFDALLNLYQRMKRKESKVESWTASPAESNVKELRDPGEIGYEEDSSKISLLTSEKIMSIF